MKKNITVLFLIVLFVSSAFSQSWTIQQSNTTQTLWSVWFLSNNIGIACGTGGVILKTTNGGTNWVTKTSGTTHDLMFMQFINSTTGTCGSINGPLLKTTNAGETWSVMAFGNLPATNSLGGGWMFDLNNSLVGFGKNSFDQCRILKTSNGGTSWDTVFTPPPLVQGWISYMHFPDAQNGYATVAYDTVYKTTNGGLNWTAINLSGNTRLWTSGVYFFNSQTGFVGGGVYPSLNGQLLKTTNGGSSWQIITTVYGIAKIQFVDNTFGYSLAANDTAGSGILIRTTNGGNNWSVFTTPTDSLNGMHFLSTSLGYAVGVRGRIIRYGYPIGIRNISTEIPDKFSLYQSYPNPFNPSTNIKFNVSKLNEVKIVVFDIMGREIQTLVNERLQPGTYETSFDGSQLTSGVYFYKISANDFSDTKRMILLK